MKNNSWHSRLIGVALFVACVMGCSKPGSDTTKTAAATPNNTSTASSTPGTTADIAGNYDVTGTNADGSPYKGELEVIKHGEAYQFRWNAGRQYDGVGVQNDGVVAVAFTGGSDGKGCGVVTYSVVADNTLDGKWGYWGVNEVGTEKAVRTSGSGLTGDYDVTGHNPGGKEYKARLSIAPEAGGYKFAWSNDSNGFGIKQGNTVSVGIGGARCAFVAYEIRPDGILDGVWGGYGSDKTGTEKATRKK